MLAASKAISRVLRHRPDAAGVTLDSHGWCSVESLLAGLAKTGVTLSRDQLVGIVRSSDKNRFALSADGLSIRANQGHSVRYVDLQLREKKPPSILFHGTVASNMAGIQRRGLLPMHRQFVHLSGDLDTARAVGGRRRGETIVLEVDAYRLHRDGGTFFVSENNVWLISHVPPLYVRRLPGALK